MEFRNLKEFHRCKALEDVDEQAFDRIVENMAKVHIFRLDRHLNEKGFDRIIENMAKAHRCHLDHRVYLLEHFHHHLAGP